jgi:methionyl-tRNA formyltransferase
MAAKLKICMIGNGTMLKSCIEIAKDSDVADLSLVLLREQEDGWHRYIEEFCRARTIRCITYPSIIDPVVESTVAGLRPDLLVSVHNPDILSERFLTHTPFAINFHPAPLPSYAGLNSHSWALMYGETSYGVTWHVLVPKVDAGDIVCQALFPIEESWGVRELIRHSAASGCALFRRLIDDVAHGDVVFMPQDLTKRTYFGAANKPFGGHFPFLENRAAILGLQRATSYFPGPNPFCMPQVTVNGVRFHIVRFHVENLTTANPPGTIVGSDGDGIRFAIDDGSVVVSIIQDAQRTQHRAAEFAQIASLAVGNRADISELPLFSK